MLGVTLLLGCSAQVEQPNDACNAIAEPTHGVSMRVVVGTRPNAMGGTIAEGTYDGVDRIDWEPTMVTVNSPAAADRLEIRGGVVSTAGRQPVDAATDRRNFRLTVSGTTLLYSAACPADGSEIEFGYTATKDELRLYKPPTGPHGYEYVLKRIAP